MLFRIYFIVVLFRIANGSFDFFYSQFARLRSANDKYPPDVLKIAKSTTPEIIARYGYPAETHHVTTEDGYILTMHRIRREGGQPFFLLHGVEDSSATYILMGPKIGLGYLLWDRGYDVWLGNTRGNRYSRNHTTLNANNRDFWQFSWHEIGIFDLPAMIDYVLNTTQFSKLYYTGHSQGTTVFWVMCSKKSQYNDKIILMQALAPVAFMSHIKTPYATMFGTFSERFLRGIGENELLPQSMYSKICYGDENLQNIIIDVVSNIVGPNPKDLNRTMWLAICCHVPAGAATNQVVHYVQLIESGRFCEYDHGPRKNIEKYGSRMPPKYNLTKVRTPVALYYSENDYLTAPVDVEYLATQLGNVTEKYYVPYPDFNHLDFVWSAKARKVLYNRFLDVLHKYPPEGRPSNSSLNER